MASSLTRRHVLVGIILVLVLGIGYVVYSDLQRPSAEARHTLEQLVSKGAEEAGRVRELYTSNEDCFEDKRTLLDPERNSECIPIMMEVLARVREQEQRSMDALLAFKSTEYDSLGIEGQKLVDDLITLDTSGEYVAFFEAGNELSESILSFRRYIESKNLTSENIASDPAITTYMAAIDASERKAQEAHQELIAYVESNFSDDYADGILRSLGADNR